MTDITVYCEAGDGKAGRLRYQLQLSSDPTICSFNHNFLRIFIFWVKHYTKNYDIYLISGESEHKNFNIFYWTNTRTLSWNCSRNQHLDYLEPEPPQNRTFDVKYRPPPPGPGSASLSSSCMLTHLKVFVSNKIELHVPAF